MSNNNIYKNRTIFLRPHWLQFVILEFPVILLTITSFAIAGLEGIPCPNILLCIAGFLLLSLMYKFIYLRRIEYRITDDQLIMGHGVFTRSSDYLELYRIVDFNEHRSIMQQIFGLKTITIYSGDRNMPKLDIIGLNNSLDLVSILRDKVSICRKNAGVYEITNRY